MYSKENVIQIFHELLFLQIQCQLSILHFIKNNNSRNVDVYCSERKYRKSLVKVLDFYVLAFLF